MKIKEKKAAYNKKWYEANKEKKSEIDKRYREANKEKRAEQAKVYYAANKEKVAERKKVYREANKEKIAEKDRKYYAANKENVIEQKKEYYASNKEKIAEQAKVYREANKEKVAERKKEYYIANKEKVAKQHKEYCKNKRAIDHLFKLKGIISSSIKNSLKRNAYTKKSRTHDILGCSFKEFKLHLESKFEPWMTWDNHGKYNGELNYGWDIDHIIPTSSATTEEDVIRLNHYTNLQPLCSYTNRNIKKDNLL